MTFGTFSACAYDDPSSRWAKDARIRGRGARGVIYLVRRRVLRLVDDVFFIDLIDNSSFNFAHAVLAFKRSQKIKSTESSYLGWLPYSFAECADEPAEASTVLGQKQGADGELLARKTLPKVVNTLLLQDFFRYRDPESAVPHYRGEVPSPQATDSGAPATSPDYCVNVTG